MGRETNQYIGYILHGTYPACYCLSNLLALSSLGILSGENAFCDDGWRRFFSLAKHWWKNWWTISITKLFFLFLGCIKRKLHFIHLASFLSLLWVAHVQYRPGSWQVSDADMEVSDNVTTVLFLICFYFSHSFKFNAGWTMFFWRASERKRMVNYYRTSILNSDSCQRGVN